MTPLCVDLDGTLVRTDTLIESLLALVKRNPFFLLMTPAWLLKGKAHLKEEIARRVSLNADSLPYNPEFLAFLRREHRCGRQIWLVTGANWRIARSIADHLDIFTEVLASDARTNLSPGVKRTRLSNRFGLKGFDYAANSASDLPVWALARRAIVVNGRKSVAERVSKSAIVETTFESSTNYLRKVFQALRLHQWAKNALVLVPLITSHNVTNGRSVVAAALAFISFGLCASSVYVLNDLMDLETDRQHPSKRTRPFASGDLSPWLGCLIIPVLAFAGLLLGLGVNSGFLVALSIYLASTLAYTFYAKKVVLLDVILLAGLYTIRIYAGAEAIGVVTSQWLLAFSMFLFLSLAFMKRFSELKLMASATNGPVNGRGYVNTDLEYVASVGPASGYISVLIFALYINSQEVTRLYSHPMLLWLICPVMLFWISRAWLLAHRDQMHDDPIVFAIKDNHSYLMAVIIAGIMMLAMSA